ncbi:MAG TPA: UDP-N-acetylmuramoyl-L-alanyl-D-glutamate--2,6-diaminopimelate ligase [Candidatus Baltobacteraceae bacterium]|nr:UDP-N-acetylmuramoyl-L-alanyl-D-glutamate--2,6-diaminopimelate ligase [Candidatus Baltobacteraceae bacterium]
MTQASVRAVDLAPLVAALDGARVSGSTAFTITALAHDSRAVRPGGAFVALRGMQHDGHAFLEQAVTAGARVLVVDAAFAAAHEPRPEVTTIVVPDTRRALSRLADAFYGHPSQGLRVVGVTGTNGKTTTTHLVTRLLEAGGIECGRIGTLGAQYRGAMWSLDNTTPLALELQSLLAEMRERGADAVAIEMSSHALALERAADVAVEVAVLTNVTRDHLDFHQSFEAYAAAKRTLFERAQHLVLNADDPLGRAWASELGPPRDILTYGLGARAQVCAAGVALDANASTFAVDGTRFRLPLPGRFNVSNALAALCVARKFGIEDAVSARTLAQVDPVPGRMETFDAGGVAVIVDYAHTPDALANVLGAVRETTRGSVTAVFGCGGDRDRGKRSEMGRIARALADVVILTSDNPRGEAPQAIVDEILGGIEDRKGVRVELDRRSAIRGAILAARSGDTVVVAGKGHETYQIANGIVAHFDDRDEVRAAVAARAEPAP